VGAYLILRLINPTSNPSNDNLNPHLFFTWPILTMNLCCATVTVMITVITMITGGSSKERVLEQIALIRQRAETIMQA